MVSLLHFVHFFTLTNNSRISRGQGVLALVLRKTTSSRKQNRSLVIGFGYRQATKIKLADLATTIKNRGRKFYQALSPLSKLYTVKPGFHTTHHCPSKQLKTPTCPSSGKHRRLPRKIPKLFCTYLSSCYCALTL